MLETPHRKQLAATCIKVRPKIDELELRQRPREVVRITSLVETGDYSFPITIRLQRVHQFALDPLGFNGVRRQEQHKPVTPLERHSNLIVPLLRTADALLTEEDRDTCCGEDLRQASRKREVL